MLHYFFFFKQKTAYEMRISDWSSDVCSSDLLRSVPHESKRESGVSISSLVPMQPVRSMPASVEFYEKLGFEIEVRRDDWGWARLRCGDCRVLLAQSANLHAGHRGIAGLSLSVDAVFEFNRRPRPTGRAVAAP